jgi:tetratricopeptide (TPR) repeat protein
MTQVMLELQDYHSAGRFAEKALQVDPGFSPAYLHLGTAYLYLAKPDLARQWLSQAQEVDPDSWVGSQAQRMLDYYS